MWYKDKIHVYSPKNVNMRPSYQTITKNFPILKRKLRKNVYVNTNTLSNFDLIS